ncbi:chemotaxis protein CheW [Sphingobium sp. B12D2B]|uniref:chemotaxis protein CheW n=1 Tax=Sphingobium sp. B12D2B TaxID=2940577 RepID=UPI00222489EE|nr:chemotaxis protein CheW [Sphingobium sp. B12D2B]MCW2348947.1 purine-binding chemotaxis protein CheW [Sphingobium sp. B12D2B]
MTDSLFLFASIAGAPITVRACAIEAVVRLGDIVPVPLAPVHVRGLAALRSRVLTVIDLQSRIFGTAADAQTAPLAIVADIAGHSYGFLIDAVTDICQAQGGVQPLRGRIDPVWRPFVSGLVDYDGRSHLLLTLADFTNAPSGALAA